MRQLAALKCIGLLLLGANALAGEVRFDGQNHLLGEFKRIERGMLYFKTPGTDTISIEWDHVDSLSSPKNLEIELDDGQILYGSIEAAAIKGHISIRQADSTESLPTMKVVRATEIEDDFRERFDGSISAGVNLTQSNDYESYNVGIEATYTTRKYYSSLDISSRRNQSDSSANAEESSLQFRSSRILKKRRYTGGLLSLYSNEALGIDLRSSLGIALGKDFIHTNSKILRLEAGLLYTHEDIADVSDTQKSEEAFVGAHYEWFRYDEPELDLTAQLDVIPSLSESGRVRADLDVTLRWEMVDDLYWKLSFSGNYDNQPPSEGASKTDYSLISGLAYDF